MNLDVEVTIDEREKEILSYLKTGMRLKEIVPIMHLSRSTVKTIIDRLRSKTNTSNNVALIAFAYEHGLLTNDHLDSQKL